MAEDRLKHFRTAKKLNGDKDVKKILKDKKLHFRGNVGSFSLISLNQKTPEQGKGGFVNEKQGLEFLENSIDILLESKKDKVDTGKSRPTPEKNLQAWIIDYAINHNHQLPFLTDLTFLTSELAFPTPSKRFVNDILALDCEGNLVVIELKSARLKKELQTQVNEFCQIIANEHDFFKELVILLLPERQWNGKVRKIIVWPFADCKPREDWEYEDGIPIEEARYKESPSYKQSRIIEIDEIVFI
jgi:hypothetical protein